MTTSVKLSAPVAERLQTQADKVHLPLDTLVERMLINSLPVYETNGFHGTDDQSIDDDFPTLEEIVAMIKATPPNPTAIQQGEKFGDMAYIQSLLDNPPTDTMSVAEWEEYWPVFELRFIIARAISPVNPVNFAVI